MTDLKNWFTKENTGISNQDKLDDFNALFYKELLLHGIHEHKRDSRLTRALSDRFIKEELNNAN